WAQGPLNAYDPTRYTGGSSSGPATGVALGLFPFAIGFDGGGSIRDPSSWSGVVGTVATFGAVRYENAETEIFTTLHCGPITTNVADAAIVLEVMANTKNKVSR
ncbi:amidase, putative, partial [Perkinsus marinus ATCC 50983]